MAAARLDATRKEIEELKKKRDELIRMQENIARLEAVKASAMEAVANAEEECALLPAVAFSIGGLEVRSDILVTENENLGCEYYPYCR